MKGFLERLGEFCETHHEVNRIYKEFIKIPVSQISSNISHFKTIFYQNFQVLSRTFQAQKSPEAN